LQVGWTTAAHCPGRQPMEFSLVEVQAGYPPAGAGRCLKPASSRGSVRRGPAGWWVTWRLPAADGAV